MSRYQCGGAVSRRDTVHTDTAARTAAAQLLSSFDSTVGLVTQLTTMNGELIA
jgi:hypothetical protein